MYSLLCYILLDEKTEKLWLKHVLFLIHLNLTKRTNFFSFNHEYVRVWLCVLILSTSM